MARRRTRRSVHLLSVVVLAGASFAPAGAAQGKVDFAKQVWPIFESRCIECHGADEQEADLRLDLKSAAFPKGDEDMWVIVPGKPDESPLFERIALPEDDPDIMPAEGDPLTKKQIAMIRKWIAEGAVWPDGVGASANAPPKVDAIVLAELSPAAAAARDKAVAAVRKRGGLALPIAKTSNAVEVNFSLVGADVKDGDLGLLQGLEPALVWLHLGRTSVTDEGLAGLASLKELRRLNLANTKIGDAGIAHLRDAAKLEYLNLYGTKVTDAGLAHLQGMKSLRKVFVWGSAVTEEGATALARALPEARVDIGRDAAALRELSRLRKPVNEVCPLTGKPLDAAQVFVHEDRAIGFCCAKCLGSFAADPKKYADKVEASLKGKANKPEGKKPEGKKPDAKKPLNEACPLTGKAVDAGQVVVHEDRAIGFCCAKCKGAFVADPKKYKAKVDAAIKGK